MRLHTASTVVPADLYKAANYASAQGQGHVYLEKCERHGSRSHAQAFDVALEGDGTTSRRRRNPGTGGNHDLGYAATYHQWGWFLAYLFDLDPTMECWAYASAEDFHEKTLGDYLLTPSALLFRLLQASLGARGSA